MDIEDLTPKQHLEQFLSVNSYKSYSHPDITDEPNVNKVQICKVYHLHKKPKKI